jgi:hypothetical protein
MRIPATCCGALLFTVVAGSAATGAQTFKYGKEDLNEDTGIAVYFADSRQTPHVFSANGTPMQMVMCKTTLDANIAKIVAAVRALPEYKDRKVVSVRCMRTSKAPINLFP